MTLLATWLVASFAFAARAEASPPDGPPRLLGASVAAGAARYDPTALDARDVVPDAAAIERLARAHLATGANAPFVLDLFPGLELDAEVIGAEVRSRGTTLYARLAGGRLGSAVVTLEAGVVAGSVSFPGGSVTMTPAPAGRTRVARVAADRFPEELPPKTRFAKAKASAPPLAPDAADDASRRIDVLVAWTPAAESATGSADAMQALAQAAVDQSNLVYLNSGIAQRLRLVHAGPVAYAERAGGCVDPTDGTPGGDSFACALYDVTGTADGQMDGIHALRDLHGADLVALMIQDYAFCGLAWMPQPPSAATADLGFSVIAQACAVGNHSFVHELGHNMGAHHDPFVLGPGPCADGGESGAFCFSRGIVNVADGWRTVMAYSTECASVGLSCPRVAYMSNPMLVLGGDPLGDPATRNNAQSLNLTARSVAAYRPTSALHPVPQRFADVLLSHPFHGAVEFVAQAGLSIGCGGGRYCPDAPVTRAQMAVFLERARRASNWAPPPARGVFADVPDDGAFAPWIEALLNDGITRGCSATAYCADQPVTRGQAAVLLLRAACGPGYVPDAPATPTFGDVPASHPFFRYVEKLHGEGFTSGCSLSPALYCPELPVTRGQMAALLDRAYPFRVPSLACAP